MNETKQIKRILENVYNKATKNEFYRIYLNGCETAIEKKGDKYTLEVMSTGEAFYTEQIKWGIFMAYEGWASIETPLGNYTVDIVKELTHNDIVKVLG